MKTSFFVLSLVISALFSNPFLGQPVFAAPSVQSKAAASSAPAKNASILKTSTTVSTPAASTTSVTTPEETCHALKFDSYFVANNVKDNIKSVNPDLTHPNFAQHLLLVRAELAMENLYLIADCATGEFFHEKLSYDFAKFSKDSNQVELKTKQGEATLFEWDGSSWIKGETQDVAAISNDTSGHPVPTTSANTVSANSGKSTTTNAPSRTSSTAVSTASSSSSPVGSTGSYGKSNSLTASYEALFPKYPAQASTGDCAKLQYSTYFRAQDAKDAIPKLNPDLAHANFAGTKLLIRTETLFEKVYLIADCKTGKFTNDILKGDLIFHPTSRLVVIKSSNNVPQLKIWSDAQWIQIPDSVQGEKSPVQNTLYGEKAALLAKSLPNPEHRDIVRFEGLKRTAALDSLFQELGTDTIASGACRIPYGKSPECDVSVQ